MTHSIYKRESKFKQAVLFFPRLVFVACYAVGWAILSLAKLIWPGYRWRRVWQRKLDSWQQLRPGFTLLTFVVLAALVMGSFHVATFVASGQRLKGQVLSSADEGLGYLTEAQGLLQNQDVSGAGNRLALALQSFEKSRADLNSNNIVLQSLLDL